MNISTCLSSNIYRKKERFVFPGWGMELFMDLKDLYRLDYSTI